jgi:MFS family permease
MGPVQRVLVSHGLAALAMSLPWPLLLVLVDDRTGTTSAAALLLGLTGAARMLPYVALSWVTGTLADRFRRDRLLRATLVARAALLGATACAVSQGWLLAAVLTATGAIAAGTPAYPALAAAMPDLAGAARRRATDTLVTVEVASFVVGPALGGLMLAPATRPHLPGTSVVLTLAALVLLRRVDLPAPSTSSHPSTVRAVLRTARRGPGVPRAIVTVALLNGVLAAVGLTLLPLAAAGWGPTGFGVATGVLGFGALAAPLLWWFGRTSLRRARAGLLLLAFALVLVPFSPHLLLALPALAVVGAAAVHVEGAATETIQDGVPDAHRAGTLGLTDSAMVGAAMLGSLVAPLMVSLLGAGWFVVLLALSCAMTATRIPAGDRPEPEVRRPAPWLPEQRQPSRPRARSSSATAPRG